jgi:hypothetical protein
MSDSHPVFTVMGDGEVPTEPQEAVGDDASLNPLVAPVELAPLHPLGEVRWNLPATITVADTVDLGSDDPALSGGKRTCVSTKRDGGRCGGPAVNGELLCSLHSGRMNPADGARAKAEARNQANEKAERALSLQRLGTRAVVAQTLVSEADNVEATVRSLLSRAAAGDIRAATALIPWLNQGLGMPTERVETVLPRDAAEVAEASSEALSALVAEGRRRRLRAS